MGKPIHYMGAVIWPKNRYGMYCALVHGKVQVAADTIAGIKQLIREARG